MVRVEHKVVFFVQIRIFLMFTENCEEVIVKSDPVLCTSVGSNSVHIMEGLFSWAENATKGFYFEGTQKRPGWTVICSKYAVGFCL